MDLREHLRFDNFSKNESVNMEPTKQFGLLNPDGHFVRKGIVSHPFYDNYNCI